MVPFPSPTRMKQGRSLQFERAVKFALAGFSSISALAAALPARAEMRFNRVSSFAVPENLPEGAEPLTPTSPEIIDVTADDRTLNRRIPAARRGLPTQR